MTILHKATASPNEVAQLADMQDVIKAFVRTWLGSSEVGVGEKGVTVLGDLLDVDCEQDPPPRPPRRSHQLEARLPSWYDLVVRKEKGSGKLWKRIFEDREVYTLLLNMLAGRHEDTNIINPLDEAEKKEKQIQLTLAQGRVLRILPRLAALDLAKVAKSEITAPTPAYYATGGAMNEAKNIDEMDDDDREWAEEFPPLAVPAPPKPGQGLLQFAALKMVDRNDMLMHLSQIDFFEAFVGITRVTPPSRYKTQVAKELLRAAVADDKLMREGMESLPNRAIEEEGPLLKTWLCELIPDSREALMRFG